MLSRNADAYDFMNEVTSSKKFNQNISARHNADNDSNKKSQVPEGDIEMLGKNRLDADVYTL